MKRVLTKIHTKKHTHIATTRPTRWKYHTLPTIQDVYEEKVEIKINHKVLIIVDQSTTQEVIHPNPSSNTHPCRTCWLNVVIFLGPAPPGAHGASPPLLDSDHQSSSSCPTSSEPPLWNNPHRQTPKSSPYNSLKTKSISRLPAAAPTFTHSDLHWVSIIRSLIMEMQDHLIETLHARLTPNLWRQEIPGRITWRRCSSCLPSSVSSVSNIIVQPFGKKISFLALKKNPEPFPTRFEEKKWEINFLTLLNISQNAPIFIF